MKSQIPENDEAPRRRRAGSGRTRALRVGGYSVVITAVVIAIAVVVNVLMGALPATATQLDVTSNKFYTLSEQTEQIVSRMEDDVTIYWVVQSGSEDAAVRQMLDRYEALSSHITVTKLDPDVYPTTVYQYVSSTDSLYNNSLIVVCGEESRYIPYTDIYVTEYDYSSYYYTGSLSYSTSWCGESELTSAINILTSGEVSVIYTLTGHGESEVDSDWISDMEKENESVQSLSLLTEESVPEDATAVMICSPSSDLSEEETDKLKEWLTDGGNLIVLTTPLESGESLPNLESLMAYYGMTATGGIVIESDAGNYMSGYPYYLLPNLKSHEITDPLISNGYYVLMPIAQGLSVSENLRDGLTVTQLLTTSDSAFSKLAGYALDTYEQESGDPDGPFALALAAEETNDNGSETKVLWISSGNILDTVINEYVSGGNEDFFLNAVGWMCGETDSIAIRAKVITTDYLTIPSGTSTVLTVCFVGIIPVAFLCVGIVIAVRRRRQ